MIDEVIRARLHDALDVEPTPHNLRARVMSSLPMQRRNFRWTTPSLEWAQPWVATILGLAIIAGLVYVGHAVAPELAKRLSPPITPAYLRSPSGIAIGPGGVVYFSDEFSSYVFRQLPDGTLATVAGTRPSGSIDEGDAGAGGPATHAYLYGPTALAFDSNGNLYIADTWAQRIRRVDRRGIVTTYAGSGPAEMGMGAFSGDGGPATRARLNFPRGIAFDRQNNLYIADSGNGRIRRVDTRGRISSLDNAGLPIPAADFHPAHLAFDASGNLYVVSSSYGFDLASPGRGCNILRRTPAGVWSVVAGTGVCGFSGDGGPATAAQIQSHGGLVFDTFGDVYFADTKNQRIRRIDSSGIITTVVAGLEFPQSLARNGADIYIAEQADESPMSISSGRISLLTVFGTLTTIADNNTRIQTTG